MDTVENTELYLWTMLKTKYSKVEVTATGTQIDPLKMHNTSSVITMSKAIYSVSGVGVVLQTYCVRCNLLKLASLFNIWAIQEL